MASNTVRQGYKRLTIDLPIDLAQRLKVFAAKQRISVADYCRERLSESLELDDPQHDQPPNQ